MARRIKRRDFIKLGVAAGVGAAAPWTFIPRFPFAQPVPAALAAAVKIPQFVDPLPVLSVAGGPMETVVAGEDEIPLTMAEFKANVMPSTFVPRSRPTPAPGMGLPRRRGADIGGRHLHRSRGGGNQGCPDAAQVHQQSRPLGHDQPGSLEDLHRPDAALADPKGEGWPCP